MGQGERKSLLQILAHTKLAMLHITYKSPPPHITLCHGAVGGDTQLCSHFAVMLLTLTPFQVLWQT